MWELQGQTIALRDLWWLAKTIGDFARGAVSPEVRAECKTTKGDRPSHA